MLFLKLWEQSFLRDTSVSTRTGHGESKGDVEGEIS